MATSADFMVDIRLRAPGVTEPNVELTVMQAAIEFCERTDVLQDRFVPGDAVAGRIYTDIVTQDPSNLEVQRVHKVWYGTGPEPLTHMSNISVATPYAYDAGSPPTLLGTAAPQGTPLIWYEWASSSTRIGIYPAIPATATAAFPMVGSLKPLKTSTTVPDALWRYWYWAIVWGALKHLRSIPNQSFSINPQQAVDEFNRYCNRAKIAAIRGRSPGSVSATMYPLA